MDIEKRILLNAQQQVRSHDQTWKRKQEIA